MSGLMLLVITSALTTRVMSVELPDSSKFSMFANITFVENFVIIGSWGYKAYTPDPMDRIWIVKSDSTKDYLEVLSDAEGIAAGDVDDDNRNELIIADDKGHVYCYEMPDFNVQWERKVTENEKEGFTSSPVIYDVDNDGEYEVVLTSNYDGYLIILKAKNGELEKSMKIGSAIYSTPAIYDVDNDGINEIIFGANNGKIYVVKADGYRIKSTYKTDGKVKSSPVIGDLDGDGRPEIVVGSYDNNLYVLDFINGSLELKWKYETGGDVKTTPALADLNGDGHLDIIFGSNDSKLYVIDYFNRQTLLKFEKSTDAIVSSPVIGDINGDGDLEIIFGSEDDFLYIITPGGRIVDKKTTKSFRKIYTSPAITNFRNFKGLEVAIVSAGRLEVLAPRRVRSSSQLKAIWPKIHGNPFNTGVYEHAILYGKWLVSGKKVWRLPKSTRQKVETVTKKPERPQMEKAEMKKLKGKINRLSIENDSLRSLIAELRVKVDSLSEQARSYIAKIDSIRYENDSLRSRNEVLSHIIDSLENVNIVNVNLTQRNSDSDKNYSGNSGSISSSTLMSILALVILLVLIIIAGISFYYRRNIELREILDMSKLKGALLISMEGNGIASYGNYSGLESYREAERLLHFLPANSLIEFTEEFIALKENKVLGKAKIVIKLEKK